MAAQTLTLRQLNRAVLARQMLLERAVLPVPQAIERLIGLQAQQAQSPFIALWTRLPDFQRVDLARLILDRSVIKATLMRATLHLATAADYPALRHAIRPALDAAQAEITTRRDGQFDEAAVLETARTFLAQEPRTFAEISALLAEHFPGVDIGAMRYTVRTRLPLAQVPIEGGWNYPGNPQFALAEGWISAPVDTSPDDDDGIRHDGFRALALRYLRAFGPASVTDLQKWSGLGKLKAAVDALRDDLIVYRDETRRELFDVPDLPLPDADTPAPARFLPEYDNLLLAHDKRTRIIADDDRSRVYLPGLRVRSTVLLDGFVAGAWSVAAKKKTAVLTIEPFRELSASDRRDLAAEGEALVRFIEPEASTYQVIFSAPFA
jgi:hypothetical protein